MAARIKPDDLAEYGRLIQEAADLESRARSLRRGARQIAERAEADLAATGRDSVRRGGYTLCWIEGRASVRWKDEFIRVAGADEAARIQADLDPPRRLQITPPAA